MSGLINIYDKRSLTNAINKMPTAEPFVLNTIFNRKQYHTSDKIDIEIRYGSDKLAQFVNADEEAKTIAKMKGEMRTVTTPRTFEKKYFSALELSNFNEGGKIYAGSAKEYEDITNKMILDELNELKQRSIRRREQMACEALALGKVDIAQDNIEFSVDYNFEASRQLLTLASADKWSATTSNPVGDILKWRLDIVRRSGMNPDMLIVGSDVMQILIKNEDVKKALDTSHFNSGDFDIRKAASAAGVWLGNLAGVDVYAYNQQYSVGSVTKDMIPAKRAILVASKNTGFRQHFGPVYRIEDNKLKTYQSEMLVETMTNYDKTALEWKVEQKCLPAIHEPDAVISALVL